MQNMKYLFLLILLINTYLHGQNTLDIPASAEFSKYLYARQDDIEEKLYYLALGGKIKPFQNDSFATVYNTTDFKERGGMEKRLDMDTMIMIRSESDRVPFAPKDITGIWFSEHVGNSKEMVTINTLKGIALTYQPVFGGVKIMPIPLCWIKTADLIKNLPHQDLEFLLQLLHYGRNSNYVGEVPEKDVFQYLNTSGQRIIKPDSSLYNKLVGMLTNSEFYISEQLYFEKGPRSLANKIFDEQLRRVITIDTFNRRYRYEVAIFIQTNPDDPTQGHDSLIYIPYQLDKVYAVSCDKQTKQLTQYHCSVYIPGIKRQEVYTFSIPINRNYSAAKPVIWFYEDYIRWKKL